ncbi:MAG: PilZ domain-containing protein [Candidatus Omnitrophica bacterium]|nr:PilZ domain-containing protein [Candidatus Omnitrophota bacterium]
MDERRQLPRWQVKKEAKVWLPQRQGFSHCVIEDINLKGMCASFDRQLPQEQPLNMSLSLDDNFDFMKVEVNLPWVKEEQGRYVYGMFFNKISEQDKDRVYQYISDNCSGQFKEKWWGV